MDEDVKKRCVTPRKIYLGLVMLEVDKWLKTLIKAVIYDNPIPRSVSLNDFN